MIENDVVMTRTLRTFDPARNWPGVIMQDRVPIVPGGPARRPPRHLPEPAVQRGHDWSGYGILAVVAVAALAVVADGAMLWLFAWWQR